MPGIKRSALLVAFASVVVMACGGGGNAPAPAEEAIKQDLQMDMTPSSNTTQILTSAQPVADYLSKETGYHITAKVPLSYAAVVEDLTSKNADIGWSGGAAYVAARNKAGAEAVSASARCLPPTVYPNEPQGKSPSVDLSQCKPQGSYPSIIVCNSLVSYSGDQKDYHGLTQLKGKKFAFGDPISTSSSIWPRYYLKQAGVSEGDFSKTTNISSQTTIAVSVANGTVDCGAMFGDARTTALRTVPDILSKTKIVFVAPELIPADPQFVRKGLNSAQKAKIKAAMIKMGGDPSMASALTSLYQINGLTPAQDKDYDIIQKYADAVQPGVLGSAIEAPASPSPSPTH